MTSLTYAALAATGFSFLVYILAAVWYIGPWIGRRSLADALSVLVWVHVFRYIALEIFSAEKFGWNIPDDVADQIIYGDVISTVIAIIALVALRYRLQAARWIVWLLVVVTVVDLANAGVQGASNELFEDTFGVPWLILVFYVPALWVTAVMMAWQLVTRRREPLAP